MLVSLICGGRVYVQSVLTIVVYILAMDECVDGWMRCILLYIVVYCCIYYQSGALILMRVMQGVILLAGDHLFLLRS